MSWIRSAAISCLIACGAMVVGPGVVGGAVASADLFGIDLDIFDIFCHNEKKCEGNDNRRGAPAGGGDPPEVRINGGTVGTEAPKRGLPEEPTRGLPEEPTRGLPGATGGGGGGAVPRSGGTDRPSNLPPVPTAPGSREIVIRGEPTAPVPAAPAPVPSAPAPAAPAPALPAPAAPVVPIPAPVVVPPVVVPPVVVPPMMPPPPAIGPVVPPPPPMVHPPSLTPPPRRVDRQPAPPGELGPQGIPVTFRDGYADYLKAATVADLAPVALSGTAGILAITALGGLVGFRQARAAQALPPANITNVVRFLQ
jgi:hypothetical protein